MTCDGEHPHRRRGRRGRASRRARWWPTNVFVRTSRGLAAVDAPRVAGAAGDDERRRNGELDARSHRPQRACGRAADTACSTPSATRAGVRRRRRRWPRHRAGRGRRRPRRHRRLRAAGPAARPRSSRASRSSYRDARAAARRRLPGERAGVRGRGDRAQAGGADPAALRRRRRDDRAEPRDESGALPRQPTWATGSQTCRARSTRCSTRRASRSSRCRRSSRPIRSAGRAGSVRT